MAKFRKGNMLEHLDECELAFITTNAMVKKDGSLVMGRGIAQQVRDMFPGIDKAFGKRITECKLHQKEYNIISQNLEPKIYAFQVKYSWWEEADLTLIRNSTNMLGETACKNMDKQFFLNYPGVGNGKLKTEDVAPIVEQLPDNVTIWTC